MILSPETLASILSLSLEELDCAGVRLHLDKVFRFLSSGFIDLSSKQLPQYEEISPNDEDIFHLPQGAYKVRYREIVRVPEDCIALAIPRSSLLRAGAALFTAVWDPGYEGRGEGLLVVYNPHGIRIRRGVQIAQLIFLKMDRKTAKIYRGSYYRENV